MTMRTMTTRLRDEYSLVIGKLEPKMMTMTTMTGTSEMRGRLIQSMLPVKSMQSDHIPRLHLYFLEENLTIASHHLCSPIAS